MRVSLLSAIAVGALLFVPLTSAAGTVEMETADAFAILAGAGITNTGSSTVTGDVGSYPTADQTGFGPVGDSVTLAGTNHHDDAVTSSAKDDLAAAYLDAASRTGGTPVAGGELGGLTLTPGVYADDNAPDSLALTGTLTLDGLGNLDSVFIFQSGSTLVTAGSNVVLIRGAQACNIFWQVTSSATLGTGSHLEGTILALTSITLETSATLNGRALAQNGAVTLDSNTVQMVPCESPPTTTPPTTPPDSTGDNTTGNTTDDNTGNTTDDNTGNTTDNTTGNTTDNTTTPPATTPPAEIPFFPTAGALVAAAVVGIGGVVFILRRRRS